MRGCCYFIYRYMYLLSVPSFAIIMVTSSAKASLATHNALHFPSVYTVG